MNKRFLALATILALASASANAADLSQPATPAALPAPVTPTGTSMPNSAFFLGLGASANWTNFGHQHVYAIGTSQVYTDGVLSASGSAQGPTNIHMEDRFAFAPSFQAGYFQRLGMSDWLWGAKLSYNYLGATSTNNNSIIPQFGTYTTITNPTPVPFSGPAYVRAAQTSLLQEIDLIPFLGHVFGQSYVYAGGGPTVSQVRTRLNGLVGFALVDGAIVDQSGAPQDFSSSSWVLGGAAVVGVTYFFTPTWFVDLNYTYAVTAGHTATFASPFIDFSSTSVGTLVGNSAWRAETQRVGLRSTRPFERQAPRRGRAGLIEPHRDLAFEGRGSCRVAQLPSRVSQTASSRAKRGDPGAAGRGARELLWIAASAFDLLGMTSGLAVAKFRESALGLLKS
jgi:opacity protein-like surface antigen